MSETRRILTLRFDVTHLTDEQIGRLEFEASVQAETTDADEYQAGKPDVPYLGSNLAEIPTRKEAMPDNDSRGFTIVLVDAEEGSEGDFAYTHSFPSSESLASFEDVWRRGILETARSIDARDNALAWRMYEILEPDGVVCATFRATSIKDALSRYAMSEGYADPRDVEKEDREMSPFVYAAPGRDVDIVSMIVTNYEVTARLAGEGD